MKNKGSGFTWLINITSRIMCTIQNKYPFLSSNTTSVSCFSLSWADTQLFLPIYPVSPVTQSQAVSPASTVLNKRVSSLVSFLATIDQCHMSPFIASSWTQPLQQHPAPSIFLQQNFIFFAFLRMSCKGGHQGPWITLAVTIDLLIEKYFKMGMDTIGLWEKTAITMNIRVP